MWISRRAIIAVSSPKMKSPASTCDRPRFSQFRFRLTLLRSLVTRTVLRCPLAVCLARRFLTPSSAWHCVADKLKRSSQPPTDQLSLVGWTRNIVATATDHNKWPRSRASAPTRAAKPSVPSVLARLMIASARLCQALSLGTSNLRQTRPSDGTRPMWWLPSRRPRSVGKNRDGGDFERWHRWQRDDHRCRWYLADLVSSCILKTAALS